MRPRAKLLIAAARDAGGTLVDLRHAQDAGAGTAGDVVREDRAADDPGTVGGRPVDVTALETVLVPPVTAVSSSVGSWRAPVGPPAAEVLGQHRAQQRVRAGRRRGVDATPGERLDLGVGNAGRLGRGRREGERAAGTSGGEVAVTDRAADVPGTGRLGPEDAAVGEVLGAAAGNVVRGVLGWRQLGAQRAALPAQGRPAGLDLGVTRIRGGARRGGQDEDADRDCHRQRDQRAGTSSSRRTSPLSSHRLNRGYS